jgi:hypothetical protein
MLWKAATEIEVQICTSDFTVLEGSDLQTWSVE